MKKNLLFITCEEAHQICDKTQYNEATLWDKIKLNIRLCWCKVTRAYTKNNKALTNAIKASNISCLNPNEKNELNKKFEHQLSNQN